MFNCKSTNVNSKGNTYHRYTKEQIDYFATFWNNKCYLVPVEECSTEKTLWFNHPANNQRNGVSMAEDYELIKIIFKEQNL